MKTNQWCYSVVLTTVFFLIPAWALAARVGDTGAMAQKSMADGSKIENKVTLPEVGNQQINNPAVKVHKPPKAVNRKAGKPGHSTVANPVAPLLPPSIVTMPRSQGQKQMDASGASGIRGINREDTAEHLRDIKELQRLHGSSPLDWARPEGDAGEDGRLQPGVAITTPEGTAGFESMAEDCRADPDACLGGALNDPRSTPGSGRRGPRDANAGPSDDAPDPRGKASGGVWRITTSEGPDPLTAGSYRRATGYNKKTGETVTRIRWFDYDGNASWQQTEHRDADGETTQLTTTIHNEDGTSTITDTYADGSTMTTGPITGGEDDQPVPHDGVVDSRFSDCISLGGGLGTVGRCGKKKSRVQDPYETPSPPPGSEGESTSRQRSGHSGPGLGAEAVTDTGGSDWSVPGRGGGGGIKTGPGTVDPDFSDPEPPDPWGTGRSSSQGNVPGVSAGGDAAMDGVMGVLNAPPGLPKQ